MSCKGNWARVLLGMVGSLFRIMTQCPKSEANANDWTAVRFTALDHAKQAHSSP
jgi:hypothetical protein